jgi:hypothetical protein
MKIACSVKSDELRVLRYFLINRKLISDLNGHGDVQSNSPRAGQGVELIKVFECSLAAKIGTQEILFIFSSSPMVARKVY